MSSAASNRGPSRLRLNFVGALLVLAALARPAGAEVTAAPRNGGPADPESPGAAVIKPLESVVPNPSSKTASPPFSAADGRFLQELHRGARGRVDAARIAAAEGMHPCVRKYAERLVDDYGDLIEEIDVLAASRRLSLPDALEPADRKLLAELQRLSAAAFDRRFVQATRDAQQRDLASLRRAAAAGQDKELRSFGDKTLPVLDEHLRMAGDLATMVNGGGPDVVMPQGVASTGCSVF